MAAASERTFHLQVDTAGRLEIPAELLGEADFSAGTRVTLRRHGDTVEIMPDASAAAHEQFIAWRDISHSLLTGGR